MRRLSRLALPWVSRVQAVAAVARRTVATLRIARTAALRVVFRARLRAAPRAVAFLLAIPWHAGPAAIVAIDPWALLYRLVRAGAASGDAVLEALEYAPRLGELLAAAAVSGLRDAPAWRSAMAWSLAKAHRRLPPSRDALQFA